jgi:16S rRNA (guanine(1405)-N(7))-methyltransferase
MEIDNLVAAIKKSKKYQFTAQETIQALVETELKKGKKLKGALKDAKRKLHNIVAAYLGDPDYEKAKRRLEQAFATRDEEEIKEACIQIMSHHASAKERLPILDEFYNKIFKITGQPKVILDLACGLNPLSFPWMDLPTTTRYFAFDIHEKRIEFLNHFFSLQGLPPLAIVQDILVRHPKQKADLALIMKEIHRFEKRREGITLPLLDALRVNQIVITLPTESLHAKINLVEQNRKLISRILKERNWPVKEIKFPTEMAFCLKKLP